MKSVELFTGAGGLGMGVSNAGFKHLAVVEWDSAACSTIRHNQALGNVPVVHWPLYEMDVSAFDYGLIADHVDLLSGGPPCQPFSIGGKHKGHQDERNMFPEVLRGLRALRPRAVLVENVKGLLRQSFAEYLGYIILQITYPEITRKEGEAWAGHLSRLERHYTGGGLYHGLQYKVLFRLLNAANYGVPQKRERAFIVAFRSDMEEEWAFPDPTHSLDALLHTKYVTGEYWERHGIARKARTEPPYQMKLRVTRLSEGAKYQKPWVTVRDAISDLPDPEKGDCSQSVHTHKYNPGARAYTGHTGSPLDEPAKTLKAGDHGVPGGENMLVKDDGSVRYFTVRESARLQTFPDSFVFQGSWTETMRQLGNAVPVTLAECIA